MTPTHAFALALIPLLTVGGAVAAAFSARVRDGLFFLMVSLAIFAERMDVNFFSHAWYRGTTRGIEVTLITIMAFGLLMGCWFGRHREARRWFWPASLGIMLLYLVYGLVSVVTSEPRIYGAFELSKMASSIVVFVATAAYVRTKREWTILLVALACAVGFEGIWAVKQRLFMGLERAAGTLDHANSLSLYLCMTVPLLAAVAFAGWTRWLRWGCALAAGLGAVGLLLTFSRAGIPVFAVVVAGTIVTCASWRLTARRVVVRALVTGGVIVLVAASWSRMEQRFSSATLEEEYLDASVDGRGIYLRLAGMLASDHFFGVGLNNWSYHVSRTYGRQLGFRFDDYDYLESIYGTDDPELFANAYLAAPAHNLAALTLGELGVPGLLLFGALWLRWFGMGAAFLRRPRTEPLRVMGVGLFFGVCGIFGQSLTEWVYRQTPILLTFYILLGVFASLTAVRRQRQNEACEAVLERAAPEAAPAEVQLAERT